MFCIIFDLLVQVGVAGLQERVRGNIIVRVEIIVTVAQMNENVR